MNPLDYTLCDRTVTLYRKRGDTVKRQVLRNCYLQQNNSIPTESYGKSRLKTFLLIIPGDVPLQPGDRIFDGIGPVEVDWAGFVPALVPEVYELSFAKPCYWEGKIAHWEAGHRKEAV